MTLAASSAAQRARSFSNCFSRAFRVRSFQSTWITTDAGLERSKGSRLHPFGLFHLGIVVNAPETSQRIGRAWRQVLQMQPEIIALGNHLLQHLVLLSNHTEQVLWIFVLFHRQILSQFRLLDLDRLRDLDRSLRPGLCLLEKLGRLPECFDPGRGWFLPHFTTLARTTAIFIWQCFGSALAVDAVGKTTATYCHPLIGVAVGSSFCRCHGTKAEDRTRLYSCPRPPDDRIGSALRVGRQVHVAAFDDHRQVPIES